MIDPGLSKALIELERQAERWLQRRRRLPLATAADARGIASHLEQRYPFTEPVELDALLEDLVPLLSNHDIDSTSPRYFGLFNPSALPVTAAADAIVAMMNPQVGTWTHAPCANLIEAHALRFFAQRIGLAKPGASAQFTSGGQEANTTAVACALGAHFPDLAEHGLRSLAADPCFYVSSHAHDSFVKAAKLVGLGAHAVRRVAVDERGQMLVAALERALSADRAAGALPFMVVATAGTTGSGAVDPIALLAEVAGRNGLWLHVDAAWGGAAAFSERGRGLLAGIEKADSVTWDAHKWLDVPMGAGMLFLADATSGARLFSVDAGYVPAADTAMNEPYASTLQWSRRFIGLKVFMALAHLSGPGYARLIEHQMSMGDRLREKLRAAGWELTNATALPVVCFVDPRWGGKAELAHRTVARVLEQGQVWLSTLTLPEGTTVLRACITSYLCQDSDLDLLVEELARANVVGEGR